MKEVLPLVVIAALLVLSLPCLKASRIVENWKQDIRSPAIDEFYYALTSRLGLHFFRHSVVLACLVWLAVAIELFFAGVNAVLSYLPKVVFI